MAKQFREVSDFDGNGLPTIEEKEMITTLRVMDNSVDRNRASYTDPDKLLGMIHDMEKKLGASIADVNATQESVDTNLADIKKDIEVFRSARESGKKAAPGGRRKAKKTAWRRKYKKTGRRTRRR